jgi:hypothetical protein
MRLRWWVLSGVAGLVLLLAGGWWATPALAAAWAARHLPCDLRPGIRLDRIATSGSPPAAPIQLQLSPSQARRLAREVSGRWIPGGLIRSGQWAAGSAAGVPWTLRITDPLHPTVVADLDRGQAAALIALAFPRQIAISLYSGPVDLAVDQLALRLSPAPPPATDLGFAFSASGSLSLAFTGKQVRLGIRTCQISGRLGLAPGRHGWQPRPALTLEGLTFADGSKPPGLVLLLLRQALGQADGPLAELVSLPPWLPPDPDVDLTVR